MKYSSLLAILLFTLSPIISFPYILYGIYNGHKSAYVFFALFWGVVAYLTLPFADLFRHYTMFLSIEESSYAEVSLLAGGIFNWAMPAFYLLMSNFHIPFDFLRFFQLSTGLWMLEKVFLYHIKINKSYSKEEKFTRFLIFFLFFDFIFTVEGVRFGWALCFYIYGLFLIHDRRKMLIGILFFVISAVIHNSFAMYAALLAILYKLDLSKNSVLLISLCGFFTVLIGYQLLTPYLGLQADWYLNNSEDYGNAYTSLTLIGLTTFFLLRLSIYPFVRLYLLAKFKNEWIKIFGSCLILTIAFVPSMVLFQRTWWLLMASGPFLLLSSERREKLRKSVVNLFVLYGVFFTVINTFYQHKIIMNSNYYKLVCPLPMILSEQYEEDWVYQHVDGNDILKENKWFYE